MRIEITADGVTYPCAPSMGAMMRFKQETGKEVTDIDPASTTELCTYLYCCTASACNIEGRDFPFSLMDFADRVTPDDMAQWQRVMTEAAAAEGVPDEGEKKSPPAS